MIKWNLEMCWFWKERTWAPFGFQNPFGHMHMVVTTTKTIVPLGTTWCFQSSTDS
jgi:hypothetical protein